MVEMDLERAARALITAVGTADDFETDPVVAAILDEVRLGGDPHSFLVHLIQWARSAFDDANTLAVDAGNDVLSLDDLKAQMVAGGTSPLIAARIMESMGAYDLPRTEGVEVLTRSVEVLLRSAGERAMVAVTAFLGHSLARAVELFPHPISRQELLSRWFLEEEDLPPE